MSGSQSRLRCFESLWASGYHRHSFRFSPDSLYSLPTLPRIPQFLMILDHRSNHAVLLRGNFASYKSLIRRILAMMVIPAPTLFAWVELEDSPLLRIIKALLGCLRINLTTTARSTRCSSGLGSSSNGSWRGWEW
jgi:hypothetical protein